MYNRLELRWLDLLNCRRAIERRDTEINDLHGDIDYLLEQVKELKAEVDDARYDEVLLDMICEGLGADCGICRYQESKFCENCSLKVVECRDFFTPKEDLVEHWRLST